MFDDPGHTSDIAPRWRERFGSFTPGAHPKSLGLTYLMIALLASGGIAFLVLM